MRIGVDATCWANNRGYGRFARELSRAMVSSSPDHEFLFFADPESASQGVVDSPNATVMQVDVREAPAHAASASGSRSVADVLRLSRAVSRTTLDVFLSPSVYTYFPLPPRLPAVVTVHDTIAERHPELTVPSRRARLYWSAKVKLALRQARLVLTVSDYSAREISEVLRVPSSRIRVASEAAASAFTPRDPVGIAAVSRRIGIPDGARWIVYVGGLNPHKRVEALVRAHADLVRRLGEPLRLVLIGPTETDVFHESRDEVLTAIAAAGTADLVVWAGFLPDDDVSYLNSGAVALALPSEREGFGLPAVEAAACATPVVATRCSPLPELLEGGGLFVDPGDVDALVDALLLLATDEEARREMGCRALARAQALSWERSAGAAVAALEEAAR